MNEHDLEARLIAEADIPGMDSALHAALLKSTTARIRGRRHRARAVRIAAVGLAFAAGMAVMAAVQPMRGSPGTTNGGPVSAADPTATTSPARTYAGFDAEIFEDPEALAFAYDDTDEAGRLRLLKAAGDYELNVRSDVRAALEYYRQWVRVADESTRSRYDETDSWLLASLKHTP